MRVQKIAVKGLFGFFDHEIPLQSAERVTIIHGPNGFGKTAMLRMIAGLVEGNRTLFDTTVFREFSVTFDDGTSAIIVKSTSGIGNEEAVSDGSPRLTFFVGDSEGKRTEMMLTSPSRKIPKEILADIDPLVPGPYRLVGTEWSDPSGKRYTPSQILDMFPSAADALPKSYRLGGFSFEAAKDLQVFFVETNRLHGGGVQSPLVHDALSVRGRWLSVEGNHEALLPRVEQYSRDVAKRIQTVLADYARHSQESDRTFPERLVRFVRESQDALPESEILRRMNELESKRRRLISLGLLDSESGLRDLTEEDVRRAKEALTIYVGDIQQKLNVFDDMSRRIGLLMDIINSRFKYKKLTIDRDNGFRAISDLGQAIRLQDLSSGEQHEVVLLYELLFKGPRKGLILVDEPEISLHVGWQSRFLSDFINILQLIDADGIVATHSPMIIGTRSDLMVELRGPGGHVSEGLGDALTR